MKNSSAASTHRVIELGPAAAAVANHRRLTTATMLNSTMSRRPRARGSVGCAGSAGAGGAGAALMGGSALQVEAMGIEHVTQQSQLGGRGRIDRGQRGA